MLLLLLLLQSILEVKCGDDIESFITRGKNVWTPFEQVIIKKYFCGSWNTVASAWVLLPYWSVDWMTLEISNGIEVKWKMKHHPVIVRSWLYPGCQNYVASCSISKFVHMIFA